MSWLPFRKSCKHATQQARRLGLERLEPRLLLSADYFFGSLGLVANVSDNVNTSNDTAFHQVEMSVATNPANPDIVAGFTIRADASANRVELVVSEDGGVTWPAANRVIIDGTGAPGDPAEEGLFSNVTHRGDPAVAFSNDGALFVTYFMISPIDDFGVVVGRLSDIAGVLATGGDLESNIDFVWASDVVNRPTESFATDKPWITVAANGSVYVPYTKADQVPFPPDLDEMRIGVSTDGGDTFTDELLSEDGSTPMNGWGIVPAVASDGTLYVVAEDVDHTTGTTDVVFGKLTSWTEDGPLFNFGAGPIDTVDFVSGNDISAAPDRGIKVLPSIAVDTSGGVYDGRIYVAYTVKGDGAAVGPDGIDDVDIVVRHSDDGGGTWSSPIDVHGAKLDNSQFHPWLDVDPITGMVAVGWLDTRNDADADGDNLDELVEAFGAFSIDGGNTFYEFQVAEAQSDQSNSNYTGNYLEYIGVDVYDGTIHMMWPDNSANAADLEAYAARIAIRAQADFDLDGDVDGNDFLIWQSGFNQYNGDATHADGDANGDGYVNGDDFLIWQIQFGQSFPGSGGGSQQASSGGGPGTNTVTNPNSELDALFARYGLTADTDVDAFFRTISDELLAQLALDIAGLSSAQ